MYTVLAMFAVQLQGQPVWSSQPTGEQPRANQRMFRQFSRRTKACTIGFQLTNTVPFIFIARAQKSPTVFKTQGVTARAQVAFFSATTVARSGANAPIHPTSSAGTDASSSILPASSTLTATNASPTATNASPTAPNASLATAHEEINAAADAQAAPMIVPEEINFDALRDQSLQEVDSVFDTMMVCASVCACVWLTFEYRNLSALHIGSRRSSKVCIPHSMPPGLRVLHSPLLAFAHCCSQSIWSPQRTRFACSKLPHRWPRCKRRW